MIETKRLKLRKFEESDYADLFDYLHEPSVNCFMSMKINDLEHAKIEAKKRSGDSLYYAIELDGVVIGEVFAHENIDMFNGICDTFDVCWMLNPKYQHKGYMFEAVEALFDYLFNELNARRIYAYTEDYNISCQNLCKRLGMRCEGLFKEFVTFVSDELGNPIYENTYQFAILKREWKND